MISVIIPLYNKQDTVARTLNSILSQSFAEFEIVVVDDGSTDHSAAVVQGYADARIKYFRKQNGGISSARNHGIDCSRYPWIMFLDADDWLLDDALLTFKNLIGRYPDSLCFVCNYICKTVNGSSLYSRIYEEGLVKNGYKDWLLGKCMPRAGAALYHRSVMERFRYKESLRRYEDAQHIVRVLDAYHYVRSPFPVMVYDTTNAQASKPIDMEKDYLGHLDVVSKKGWARVWEYEMYRKALRDYPEGCKKRYGNYRSLESWLICKMCGLYRKLLM
ncbi:MAG: glycosyltransferase family 2 protein [Prevotella sp.]